MSLKERIYGLETEYAINFYMNEGLPAPNAMFIVQVLQECLLKDCGIALSNFLVTGGKFHHDVGHAEWALPECRSVRELVAYDKAADHSLRRAVVQAEQKLKHQGFNGHLMIAKNNVDSAGNAYGTHENYLMMRDTDLLTGNYFRDYLMYCLIPFLVTRQIFAGSGHLLISPVDGHPIFEISQRARFINTVINADTMHYRPLINLGREEEPLAIGNYRRFHLILGDANLSGWATWMKVATLSIILRMIEDIFISDFPAFKDPVDALHAIADDPTCRIPLPMRDGKYMSALDIQWQYLELASTYLEKYGSSDEERSVMDAWERALTDLKHDPVRLRDRSDWVFKKYLMDTYLQKQGLSFEDISGKDESVITALQSYDLLYHDISSNGLFSKLWPVDTLVSSEEIRRAQTEPPRYTRARIRGTVGLLQEQYQIPVAVDAWMNASISNVAIELPDPLEFDHPQLYAIGKDPLRLLEQAVKRSPEKADVHYRLGCFYLHLLRLKKAVRAFEEAIRIDANQADSYIALARALVLQGEYEKAIVCCQTAHQLTTERSQLHFSGMGEAYRYLGRNEQALKAYFLQLKITPNDLSTHENIGQVYLRTGQIDEAEKTFLSVHEQDPERPVSALALGMIRLSHGAKKLSVQAPLQQVLAPLSTKLARETTPSAMRYLQAFASIGIGDKEGLSLLQQALQHRTPLAAQGIFLVAPLIEMLNHAPKPPRTIQRIRALAQSAEMIPANIEESEEQSEMAPLEDSLWWREAIQDSNELIRARAAQYALWRNEGEAIPLLQNLLINDESDHVRCTAAKALATLGNEEAGSILFACLQNPDSSIPVKWAAEEGLERIRRGKAKPPYPWEMAEAKEQQEWVEPRIITLSSLPSIPPIPTFASIRLVQPQGAGQAPVVCSLCGASNPAGEEYCSNCGTRIERTMAFSPPPTSFPTGNWGSTVRAPVQPPSPPPVDPWSVPPPAVGWDSLAQAQQPQAGGWGMPAQQQQVGGWGAPAQPEASGWGVPSQQQQPAWGAPAQPAASGWGTPPQQPPAWGVPSQQQQPAWGVPAQPVADAWGNPVQLPAQRSYVWGAQQGSTNFPTRPAPLRGGGTQAQQSNDPWQVPLPPPVPVEEALSSAATGLSEDDLPDWLTGILRDESTASVPTPPRPSPAGRGDGNDDDPLIQIIQ